MNIRPIVLVVREPKTEERVVTFELREVRIGVDPESSDLCLDHPSVSPELRARLRRQDGELVLTSYCAAAAVRVNGQVINMRGVVHSDVISIGEVQILLVSEAKLDPREQALVDDIVSDPTDETVREVYADWLEENGFADRAAYLRLDAIVARAFNGTFERNVREDAALLIGLSRNLPPAWLALMSRARTKLKR